MNREELTSSIGAPENNAQGMEYSRAHVPPEILAIIESNRPIAYLEFEVSNRDGVHRFVLEDLQPPLSIQNGTRLVAGEGVVSILSSKVTGNPLCTHHSKISLGCFDPSDTIRMIGGSHELPAVDNSNYQELLYSQSYYVRSLAHKFQFEQHYANKTRAEVVEYDVSRLQSALREFGIHDGGNKIWLELTGMEMLETASMYPSLISERRPYFGLGSAVMSSQFGDYLAGRFKVEGGVAQTNPFSKEYQNPAGSFEFGILDVSLPRSEFLVRAGVYYIPSHMEELLLSSDSGRMVYRMLEQVLDWSHHDFTSHASMLFYDGTNQIEMLSPKTGPVMKFSELHDEKSAVRNDRAVKYFETWALAHHLQFTTELLRANPVLLRFVNIQTIRFERLLTELDMHDTSRDMLRYIWCFSINRIIQNREILADILTVTDGDDVITRVGAVMSGTSENDMMNMVKTASAQGSGIITEPMRPAQTRDILRQFHGIIGVIEALQSMEAVFQGKRQLTDDEMSVLSRVEPFSIARYMVYVVSGGESSVFSIKIANNLMKALPFILNLLAVDSEKIMKVVDSYVEQDEEIIRVPFIAYYTSPVGGAAH